MAEPMLMCTLPAAAATASACKEEDGGYWDKLWHTPGVIEQIKLNDGPRHHIFWSREAMDRYRCRFRVNVHVFHPAVFASSNCILAPSPEAAKAEFTRPSLALTLHNPSNRAAADLLRTDPLAFRLRNNLFFHESRAAAIAFLIVWRRLRHSTFRLICRDIAVLIAKLLYLSFDDDRWFLLHPACKKIK